MTAERPDPGEPKRWLESAREDLAYGEGGRAAHPRPATWSFQQAAEKALKAVLLAKGRPVPRTHDVAFLLSGLADIIPETQEVRDAVLLLATITSASRYPDDSIDIRPRDAAEFALAARTIVEWAQQHSGTSPRDISGKHP
ncbi:MAG: HEPN domain-containing protein [Opitutae bacterium]|nr:HEPN domain-containing protein [Opitutae bacterium]